MTPLSTFERPSSLPVYQVSYQTTTRIAQDEPIAADELEWLHFSFPVCFSPFNLVLFHETPCH